MVIGLSRVVHRDTQNHHHQWCHYLVSSEVSGETAFPRASWRDWAKGVVGRGYGREALGKAVSSEAEPRSVAEPNVSRTTH